MINLLPPEYKEELRQEENYKLILILGILILAFLISFLLILLSIRVHLAGMVETEKIFFEAKTKEFSSLQSLEKELNSTNKELLNLSSFYEGQFSLTDFLKRISEILPPGLYLNSFSYQKEGVINLSGFSPTVEDLLRFKENLESQGDFKEISFPTSVWFQSKDINFNVSFKIIPKSK